MEPHRGRWNPAGRVSILLAQVWSGSALVYRFLVGLSKGNRLWLNFTKTL